MRPVPFKHIVEKGKENQKHTETDIYDNEIKIWLRNIRFFVSKS